MTDSINIIGCGRAAGSLARLWLEAGVREIGSVMNRSRQSSQQAVSQIGAGRVAGSIEDMVPATAWLIGVSDAEISGLALKLAESDVDLDGALVFHLAGRFGPDILALLVDRGARIAALHPVRSLTHSGIRIKDFAGTACLAEGCPESLSALRPLVDSIGGTWLPVDRIDRGLYHAAVSVISNITKAVTWKAGGWMVRAGLPEDTAATVAYQLLNSTVEDLFRAGASKTITGPIVRGDTSTIEAHIEAIRTTHPADLEVYRVLAGTVVDLARHRGDLDDETLRRFERLLSMPLSRNRTA